MKKVTVGQRLFSLNIGNAARRAKQVLKPVIVTKVGRKYFTVKTEDQYGFETEYCLENWCENTKYSPDSKLYEKEQQWEDEKEISVICEKIRRAFEYGKNNQNIDLEKLRMIFSIVFPNEKTK